MAHSPDQIASEDIEDFGLNELSRPRWVFRLPRIEDHATINLRRLRGHAPSQYKRCRRTIAR